MTPKEIVEKLRSSHSDLRGDDYWNAIYSERKLAADLIERLTAPATEGEVEEIARAIHEEFWKYTYLDEIGTAAHVACMTWESSRELRQREARAILALGYRKPGEAGRLTGDGK